MTGRDLTQAEVNSLHRWGCEYRDVIKRSADPHALIDCHRWGLNPDSVEKIIEVLSRVYDIETPGVVYTSQKGNARERRISLPSRLLDPELPGYGRLRLGLVLHEFAHFLVLRRIKDGDFGGVRVWPHGQQFVDQLDELVRGFGSAYMQKLTWDKAAGAKGEWHV